jgi:hypothetical protein
MGSSSVTKIVIKVYINDTAWDVFRNRQLLQGPFFAVACTYLSQRPSFVTGDELSKMD